MTTASPRLYAGPKTLAAATATRITATKTPLIKGVVIKNPSTASASVWVGGSNVDATHGFELEPGEKEFVAVDDLSTLYLYSTGGQDITYLAY